MMTHGVLVAAIPNWKQLQESDLAGQHGETEINRVKIIKMTKGLIYMGVPSNMNGYSQLMSKNYPRAGLITCGTELLWISELIVTYMDS